MNLHLYNTQVKDPVTGEMIPLAVLGGGSDEAIQAWLDEHPEALSQAILTDYNTLKSEVDGLIVASTENTSGWTIDTATADVEVSNHILSHSFENIPTNAVVVDASYTTLPLSVYPYWRPVDKVFSTDGTIQLQVEDYSASSTARMKLVYAYPRTIDMTEVEDIRVGADGTTYSTAGDAVRGQYSDLKNAIDDVTLDKSGTNINNCGYEGGYIASNGTDTTASSYESVAFRSSGYIPVIGGETLYWWGKLSDGVALGANAVIVEYDSSKNLIGTRNAFDKYGTTATNQAFTTSQNAAYVRIALYQGVTDKSTIQIALYYSGDEQEAFVPYQSEKVINYNKVYTESGESLDDVIDGKILDIGFTPLYEKQAITVTGVQGALKPDGTVTETNDVTRYKIPVSAGEKYVVSARHGYAYRAFLVLDSNDNVLSYYPNTTSGTAIHRNVEVNIAEDGFLVVQDVYNFPPYIGKAVYVDFNDKLYQKSIYWNGDSICYGAGGFSFANQIGLIHAMPETMDAVSGTRLSTRTGRTDSIYDRVVAMGTTAEYDFIGIEGGYNDYFSSVPIGTLMSNYTDTPDTTTVIGAVEGICKHIRTNFPNSKFFFVLGHRPITVGAYPTEVDTYWDAIISALEKWAVPYVDIRKEGTLMAYNADWLADYFGQGETMGTHPNTEGYTKFYNPLVEDIMKSL